MQLNGFPYCKWSNSSIWPIGGSLTGTTTSDQSGYGSTAKEGILYISKVSGMESYTSVSLVSYPGHRAVYLVVVMVKAMDCRIVVSEFELQSR